MDRVEKTIVASVMILISTMLIATGYNQVTNDWKHQKAMKREMFKRCWNGTKPILWSCKVGDLI